MTGKASALERGEHSVAAVKELKIAICDDEAHYRDQVTGMTRHILQNAGIDCELSVYQSGTELLDAIRDGSVFHILLLDVVMEPFSGMELAALLRKQKNRCAIVFISGNLEMALQGYEVSAARFLSKPVDEARLEEALLHCCSLWQEKKEILLPTDQGQYRTSFSEIWFVEAFDRGTRFVLTDKTVETKLKFSEAEAMLPKSMFLQCHRAFLVNLHHVRWIRPNEFELMSGALVPISKHRYSEVNKKFFDYLAD